MNQHVTEQAVEDCWNRIGVRGDRSCDRLPQHRHCRHCDVHAGAAAALLQRSLPPEYRQEWAREFAPVAKTETAADQSALVFRLGYEWLALPARMTITIAEHALPHRLPHRHGGPLQGIINVKGRLYPCMSLDRLLGIAPGEPPAVPGQRVYPRLLVMQFEQQAFALPVQDLTGIHRYAASDLQALPATFNSAIRRFLTGMLVVGDRRVGCIDAQLVGHQLAGELR